MQKYEKIMIYPIEVKGKTKKQVTKLSLSGRSLTTFPENIFEYTNLTKLVLSNNKIKTIPKEIQCLKKLEVLDLANNDIKVLHSAVFHMPKLRVLNVYGNQIKKFPKQAFDSNLLKLIAGMNPINPDDIEKLRLFFDVVVTKNEEPVIPVTNNEKPEEKMFEKDKKHSIFISYSHEDKEWLDKVLKNLKPLKRYYDNVETWSDKQIIASDIWKEEIDKALNKATIAILLVSIDFVGSDFITNEELQPLLDKAQADGTKIMPLIVRPCAFFEECGLSKYQAVNNPKTPLSGMSTFEQEKVLVDMVEAIKVIIKK